ncbi:MAG: DUF2934 domain-containing protein [Myxococcaceae bacterium]
MAKSTSKQSQPNGSQPQFSTPSQPQRNTFIDRAQTEQRAYELFLARGSQHGHDVEDWLQAEREVRTGRQ